MSTSLYFIPNHQDVNLASIPAECNLSETLRDAHASPRVVTEGPDGLPGMLFAIHPAPNSGGEEAFGVHDDLTQEWGRVQDKDGKTTHFVGYEKGKLPRPEDLLRPDSCGGWSVDGFLVPIIHIDAKITTLPKDYAMAPGGFELQVDERYRALTEEAFGILKELQKADDDPDKQALTPEKIFHLAVGALAVNYRIGINEACFFKLLKGGNRANKVCRTALGLELLEELLSKKANRQPNS